MLPSYVPALCLAVAAFSLFFLSILWSRAWLLNLCIKLSIFGMAVWAFLAAATGRYGSVVFIMAIVLQGFGILLMNRMWAKVLVGAAMFITIFGFLAYAGVARF